MCSTKSNAVAVISPVRSNLIKLDARSISHNTPLLPDFTVHITNFIVHTTREVRVSGVMRGI